MKEWLPHLLTALVALTAACFAAFLTGDEVARQGAYERIYEAGGNETIQAPSTSIFAWATAGFALIGGFYLGVSVVHFRLWLRMVQE